MFGQCSICQEYFIAPSEVSVIYCGHIFHQYCILQWFERSSTCPQCRKPASERTLVRQLFVDQQGEECSPTDSSIFSSTSPQRQNKEIQFNIVGKLKNKISELESVLSAKDRELNSSKTSLIETQEKLKGKSSEVRRLTERLTNTEGSLKTLRDQLSPFSVLKEEKKQLEDQVKAYKKKLNTCTLYEKVLYGSKEEAGRAVSKCDAESLPKVLDVLKGQYDGVRDEKKKLSQTLYKVKDEKRQTELECEKNKKMIKDLREEVRALQKICGLKTSGYKSRSQFLNQEILENSVPCLSDPSLDGETSSCSSSRTPFSCRAVSALGTSGFKESAVKKDSEVEIIMDSPNVMLPGGQTSRNMVLQGNNFSLVAPPHVAHGKLSNDMLGKNGGLPSDGLGGRSKPCAFGVKNKKYGDLQQIKGKNVKKMKEKSKSERNTARLSRFFAKAPFSNVNLIQSEDADVSFVDLAECD